MFDIKGLRTFAMSAKDLDKSVQFYTNTLGGKIVKSVEPTKEQKQNGQVKEVDVRLGNFEVHWQEKDQALSALQNIGANIEKVRPHRDSENYSINVFDPDGNRWELSFVKGN